MQSDRSTRDLSAQKGARAFKMGRIDVIDLVMSCGLALIAIVMIVIHIADCFIGLPHNADLGVRSQRILM